MATPDSVTEIRKSAFEQCYSLESVQFGENSQLTKLESRAFFSCRSLIKISVPQSVGYIDSFVFYDCSALESISLPDGLTVIGNQLFQGCSSLTSIEIPEGVATIGYGAFRDCD